MYKAFSLRDKIGTCFNIGVETDVVDKTPCREGRQANTR